MKSSLVQYDNLPQDIKHTLLPPPETKYITMVLLLKKSNKIVSYHYIICKPKKNICQLILTDNSIPPKLTTALYRNLPKNNHIYVAVSLKSPLLIDLIEKLVKLGFTSPYISDKSLLGRIDHSLIMVRSNSIISEREIDKNQTLMNIFYILQQYGSNNCSILIKFCRKALKFLRKTSKMGHSVNGDHSITQKELGGSLKVVDIQKYENRYVYKIGIDTRDLVHGKEETINLSPTRYNFHSHPEEAYVKHSVHKAWPSLSDYIGLFNLGNKTIFHCVATLEGIYIMSFGSYWVNKLKQIPLSFIKDNYKIDHKNRMDPFEYMTHINTLLYKNYPIFQIKYLPWEGASKTIFGVFYSKSGLTCLPSEKLFWSYEQTKKIFE